MGTDYGGSHWCFASLANKAAFEKEPAKYVPQFGGFCSFAASTGFTAKTDPELWKIEGGKLYLFNSADFRDKWASQLGQGIIAKAEANWAKRPQ
jgi:hypothetical protein